MQDYLPSFQTQPPAFLSPHAPSGTGSHLASQFSSQRGYMRAGDGDWRPTFSESMSKVFCPTMNCIHYLNGLKKEKKIEIKGEKILILLKTGNLYPQSFFFLAH